MPASHGRKRHKVLKVGGHLFVLGRDGRPRDRSVCNLAMATVIPEPGHLGQAREGRYAGDRAETCRNCDLGLGMTW